MLLLLLCLMFVRLLLSSFAYHKTPIGSRFLLSCLFFFFINRVPFRSFLFYFVLLLFLGNHCCSCGKIEIPVLFIALDSSYSSSFYNCALFTIRKSVNASVLLCVTVQHLHWLVFVFEIYAIFRARSHNETKSMSANNLFFFVPLSFYIWKFRVVILLSLYIYSSRALLLLFRIAQRFLTFALFPPRQFSLFFA